MAVAKPRRENVQGTIYLLHFERPFKHARHYLGWTEGPVEERIADHRSGRGARLTAVVSEAGIKFSVVKTWAGTRALERRLKCRGKTALCPVCSGENVREPRIT